MTNTNRTNSLRKPITHSLPHKLEVLNTFQEKKAELELKLANMIASKYPDQLTIDRIKVKLKEIDHLIAVQQQKVR